MCRSVGRSSDFSPLPTLSLVRSLLLARGQKRREEKKKKLQKEVIAKGVVVVVVDLTVYYVFEREKGRNKE